MANRSTVFLDGESLTVEQVAGVARRRWSVALTPAARARMGAGCRALDEILDRRGRIYGVTTGFGALQGRPIGPHQLEQLQRDLVRSHAAGVGPPLPDDVVRAMLVVRINALAKGASGVRPQTVDLLVEMLNRNVLPVVPVQGSLGASGDLAQLAHVALALLGEGEARLDGELLPAAVALRRAGLQPLPAFGPKEALALVNGTAAMAGGLALAVADARVLADAADVAGALSFAALGGLPSAFDPAVHDLRPHPGQRLVAARLRRLIEGTESRARAAAPACLGEWARRVQDAYSLRCMPQVHGASRDTLAFVERTLSVELNAATDNPLIVFAESDYPSTGFADTSVPRDDSARSPVRAVPRLVCQGNFHGQPLAFAADFLAIALAELASIAERRIAQLLAGRAGLPLFLAPAGTKSGYMIAQYTAAALVSENKGLCHPASVDSIPSSADQEDHVSMGWTAVRKLRPLVENVSRTLAIELCTAARALDLRQHQPWWHLRLGPPLAAAYAHVRTHGPATLDDEPLHPHFEAIHHLLLQGALAAAVEPLLVELAVAS